MRAIEYDARTIQDAVNRLVTGEGSVRTYSVGRVDVSIGAREAHSYGRHFPLFRFVPKKDRRPALFVINGDRWNGAGRGWNRSRTPDHQDSARRAIADTGIASLVLPFSALDGAGIDIDSIRPLHVRADEWFEETVERRTWDELPRHRRTYREPVQREYRSLAGIPNVPMRHRPDADGDYNYGPPLADADGFYRWVDHVERRTVPDADGIYRWTEQRHRLGDSLFTAERTIVETRPAFPFEVGSSTARETVSLSPSGRRGDGCSQNEWRDHVAGPDGTCIHCNGALLANVTYRRRARYLSSFDMNEPVPLYFLCEVPRTGAPTVDGAIDSLAPRAVHAAMLAGKEVRRQGDVFFIDTPLTRETLMARGATFGRLTQWTRDAKPRAGEVTFVAPNRDRDKATAKRELAYARRLWKETYREAVRAATAHERPETAPMSKPGYRAVWAKRRADRDSAIMVARANLRRATWSTVRNNRYVHSRQYHGETDTAYRRRCHLAAIVSARQTLERAIASSADNAGHIHSRHARDVYRARYGGNAQSAWIRACDTARRRYRPETVQDHARAVANREAVRRHLMVYGTAHSATEVARVGNAVYVRGTVVHAVTLESGRGDRPDHIPVRLTPDRWYLAVRNTVPRQNRRPRRRNRTVSGN